jgi:hypothetical protein
MKRKYRDGRLEKWGLSQGFQKKNKERGEKSQRNHSRKLRIQRPNYLSQKYPLSGKE